MENHIIRNTFNEVKEAEIKDLTKYSEDTQCVIDLEAKIIELFAKHGKTVTAEDLVVLDIANEEGEEGDEITDFFFDVEEGDIEELGGEEIEYYGWIEVFRNNNTGEIFTACQNASPWDFVTIINNK